ncbi:MAG: NigD-like N-terminal domain-containing protein [Bacteroidaceae bacterium]|nr:NigD-like N-terminal domain-containing protein [Bacteroidaceae bacterium]
MSSFPKSVGLGGLLMVMASLCGWTSCSDDEAVPAPVRFDLCEVVTGTDGYALSYVMDDGQRLLPANKFRQLRPDTTYRALLGYQINHEGKAAVHQLSMMLAPLARRYGQEQLRTDPVRITSLWRSARYVNLRVGIPRSGQHAHYLGFHEVGVQHNADSTRTLELQLFHDARGDRADFYDDVTLSCPLYPYAKQLRAGTDSVAMWVQTSAGRQRTAWRY